MSRICGFDDTTTGHPCENVVEDFEDHCRAGHPCLPASPVSILVETSDDAVGFTAETEELASHWAGDKILTSPPAGFDHPIAKHAPDKTPKPILSQETLDLRTKAKALRAQYEEALVETLATEAPAPHSTSRLAALREKALECTTLASKKQTLELFADCLGSEFAIEYVETKPAEWLSPGGGDHVGEHALLMPYALAQFFRVGNLSTTLVRGQFDGHTSRHWYVETACTEVHGEDSPSSRAYVRLKGERDWYGRNRRGTAEERRNAFDEDLDRANKVVALCSAHRALEKGMPSPKSPDDDPVKSTESEA